MISPITIPAGCQRSLASFDRRPNDALHAIREKLGYFPVDRGQAQEQIENFVDDVVQTNRRVVKLRVRACGYGPGLTQIGQKFFSALLVMGYFDSRAAYPPKVYAFLEACWFLEDALGVNYTDLAADPYWSIHTHAYELNAVLERIRMLASQGWCE